MSTPIERYDAAMLLQREGKNDEAAEALKTLVAQTPDFALGYNALGAMAKKNNDLIEAIRYAEKYCELEPEDSFGYTILSSYCIAAGMREKAEEALGQAQDIRLRAHFNES